ncbi:organoarsenical effux MFS transporter ArsJ [Gilvimarinus sp. SDUM040013]|uniref:Organoarsenical effux MFS transporter ArsJ n=1 Tax=Gilvimarinus gilvus TaxID=3058038 RepID=A0ABU4S427_9GAMM|nr:organoarsenical effux MFS transporter ArsJ [Gilvimarinus sp. SDUM040013]MDO3385498.1 organoarsenical effux MFS transporter ArsJ [Gilvimarinus sp. SDUM040013]MDX6851267.1 organoarsenical effux MFS transporter ArsJ [Gilvimarinus sp. SDUM040013]
MQKLAALPESVRQYLLITANYWVFTLTDGALRMLVVLHFYKLGYAALDIALLFLFYEIFGVVTNLFGGWLGARVGLNRTMNLGLLLQVLALAMLLVPSAALTLAWVMAAQALSGIAKDLNKMSAKSAIKLLVPKGENSALFRWVALLTGSKNALKGAGFFLGGALLSALQFQGAVSAMLLMLGAVWLLSILTLKNDLGRGTKKSKITAVFSKSRAINVLAAARLCLFAARDVWFVVALPVYLASKLAWPHWQVGSFLAAWIIGYGVVQTVAPKLFYRSSHSGPGGTAATTCATVLTLVTATLAAAMSIGLPPAATLVIGLMIFGVAFAVNSSLHSYLIVSYARDDGVSLDVGFYYSANAAGRLLGTVLSGWLFQAYGLIPCLWVSAGLLVSAALLSLALPKTIDPA